MAETLLALLVCGHMLGDFVFQTGEMVRRKDEHRWLLLHVSEVILVQALVVLPFLSLPAVAVLAGVALAHALTDRLKIFAEGRWSHPLGLFVLDQLLHLAALVVAWRLWLAVASPFPLLEPFEPWLGQITAGAVVVAAYAFNWNGGAAVVGLVLQRFDLPKPSDDSAETLAMGRTIGILERMILLTLVLGNQWAALGLVLAAKSIARFKDLDRRSFSEYYLIGTLTSVLVAIATGLLVKLLT